MMESRVVPYPVHDDLPPTFGIIMRLNPHIYELNYTVALGRLGYEKVEQLSKYQAARAELWWQAEMEKWILVEGYRHEAIQWLTKGGHNFLASTAPWHGVTDQTVLRVTITDKDAAMLFKLTWAGVAA